MNAAIRQVYDDCQREIHGHAKLIKTLTALYNQMSVDEFWAGFCHDLRPFMIVLKHKPYVERTIEFVTKFATSLCSKDEENQEESDEDLPPFLVKFFDFLLQSHRACDKAVRYRTCQLLNKLLAGLGEDIDNDLYERIYEAMLERLKDKYFGVRMHAVGALTRLQDPSDSDCPVIEAFLFLLKCDPAPDVRRSVLYCIAPSTKTLPHILSRIRDTNNNVRKMAYQVLADKVQIRALTIAQRVGVLKEGLNDRNAATRQACASRLLQAWLLTHQGNALSLLEALDVEGSAEVCDLMLDTLFKKSPLAEVVNNCDILDNRQLIKESSMTCESVFYWRSLAEFIQKQAAAGEDYVDKILPNVTELCNFIKQQQARMCQEEDLDTQLQNEFILQQLLTLAGVLDLSDEVGRRNLRGLLREFLVSDTVGVSLIKPILALYKKLVLDPGTRVLDLVEAISDVRSPMTTVETAVSAEEKRRLDLKLAGVRVELNECKEALEGCVERQDFSGAADLKTRIESLDHERQELLQASVPSSQEVRVEKDDPATLLKCLTVACEMLRAVDIKTLMPAIQTLVETLILPGIQNQDPAVRNVAVKSLGLSCLRSVELAQKHLFLFVQVSQMDQEVIQVMALSVIFDFLLVFGLGAFQVEEREEPESEGEEPAQTTPSTLLNYLISLLDSASSEVRTLCAEGLAKLMFSRHVVSPSLFSRLLLLWHNPVTEDDTHLRHCLGTFFTVYAFASRSNQDVVEQAVLPTLRLLFNAPAASPLAEVNETNVAGFLVELTSPVHLARTEIKLESSCHDSLAVSLCNEMLLEPQSFSVQTLSRMLSHLSLTPSNVTCLQQLSVLNKSLLTAVTDKTSLRLLTKFQSKVSSLLSDVTENLPPNTAHTDIEEEAEKSMSRLVDTPLSQPRPPPHNQTLPRDVDDAVFASPSPVRHSVRGRRVKDTHNTTDVIRNLESDLSEEPAKDLQVSTGPRHKSTRSTRSRRPPLGGVDGNQLT